MAYAQLSKLLGWLRSFGIVAGIGGWFLLALSIFAMVWTLCEAGGVSGSPVVLGVLLTSSGVFALILVIAALPLRWHLVSAAVDKYVRQNLSDNVLGQHPILVGDGPGAAIIGGMMIKAFQRAGRNKPPLVILDLAYDNEANAVVGEHSQLKNMENVTPLIVLSAITTGKNLARMREIASLQNAPAFSFVVEPGYRNNVEHVIVTGSRTVLPWEQHRS